MAKSLQESKRIHYAARDATVDLFIGGERIEAWEDRLESRKLPTGSIPPDDPNAEACMIRADTGKACAIWTGKKTTDAPNLGRVAHEASHAALHIITRSGGVLNHRDETLLNDEPLAYLVEAIVRDLVDFIRHRSCVPKS